LAAVVRAYFEETGEQLVVEARLLASEPSAPPSDPAARKAWEARVRTRRAAIRRALAELADLAAIAEHEERAREP
jgi:hypothetical protein